MLLGIYTDALYLSEYNINHQAAPHFYLNNENDKDFKNGTILTLTAR
jgi:hypothetical protein